MALAPISFVLHGAVAVTCLHESQDAASDIWLRVKNAHTISATYMVEGWVMAPSVVIKDWPPLAREWFSTQDIAQSESKRLSLSVVPIENRRWYGSQDGKLRCEIIGMGSGGDPTRSTVAEIWLGSERLEGVLASSTPSAVIQTHALSTQSELSLRNSAVFSTNGRGSEWLQRVQAGGYIEAVQYSLKLLESSPDTRFVIGAEGDIFLAYSNSIQIAISADVLTGEVETITMGSGQDRFIQRVYKEHLPAIVFPARQPKYEYDTVYSDGTDTSWRDIRPPPDGSNSVYWVYTSAEVIENNPQLFEWSDPDFDRSKVPDASALNSNRATIAGARPQFVPSKTNPGRVVPNIPKSRMKTVLLASGIALLLGGGMLAIRRRMG